MGYSEDDLIARVRQGDINAFEELYKKYYVYLCLIAEHIVRNSSDAEEIVSDVFIRLWNLRERTEIRSIKTYLICAVRNTSLNYIEQNKMRNRLTCRFEDSDLSLFSWDSDYPLGRLYEIEVTEILRKGINSLPDGCREVFLLSRHDGMKYSDIAERLGISVNTVKTQMKIALSRLRDVLKNYLLLLLILF